MHVTCDRVYAKGVSQLNDNTCGDTCGTQETGARAHRVHRVCVRAWMRRVQRTLQRVLGVDVASNCDARRVA